MAFIHRGALALMGLLTVFLGQGVAIRTQVHNVPITPADSGVTVQLFNNTGLGGQVIKTCISPSFDFSCLNIASYSELIGQSMRITAMYTPSAMGEYNFSIAFDTVNATVSFQLWADDHLVMDSLETSQLTSVALLPVASLPATPLFMTLRLRVLPPAASPRFPRSRTPPHRRVNGPLLSLSVMTNPGGEWTPLPATALSPTLSSSLTERMALRDRLRNVGWGTWYETDMLNFVSLPSAASFALGFIDSSGANFSFGVHVPNQNKAADGTPLFVRPGLHMVDQSYINVNVTWRNVTFVVEASANNTLGNIDISVSSTNASAYSQGFGVIIIPSVLYDQAGNVAWSDNNTRSTITTPGLADISLATTVSGTPSPVKSMSPLARVFPLQAPISFIAAPSLSLSRRTVQRLALSPLRIHTARLNAYQFVNEQFPPGAEQDLFTALHTVVTWNTAYIPQEGQVTPVGRGPGWNFGAGYVLFMWDTYFLSIMASEWVDKDIAYMNVIQNTRQRTMHGLIPNYGSGLTKSRDRTEPAVAAFAVWLIYNKYKETWLLDLLYDDLKGFLNWMWERRSLSAQGVPLMVLGSDPNIPNQSGSSNNKLEGAVLESGLDNSPMYDWPMGYNTTSHHMDLTDVGVTALFIHECQAMVKIATALGKPAGEIEVYTNRSSLVKASMQQHLWDDKGGIFKSRHYKINRDGQVELGSLLPRVSPTNFYPLLTDGLPSNQVISMCGYLQAKENFCISEECPYALPSIARWDLAFWEQNYWRGRIWGPMNFLVWSGLQNYAPTVTESKALAQRLAVQAGALLLKEWGEFHHVHENYDALTGRGCDRKDSSPFYHWGALHAYINISMSTSGGMSRRMGASMKNAADARAHSSASFRLTRIPTK